MPLGTPVAGTVAYSTSGGTSVSPSYPSGITANHALILIIGQKPSSANGGTVTTPSGWTLRQSLTGAGGYGTTLGADTGNTNLRVYTKDTVTGSESGALAVTLATNNVSWGVIIRVPTDGAALSFTGDTGSDTSAGSVSVTIASDPGFKAGDLALWAMCIPTDVTTPSQFSAHSISATGATFASATELTEPDSAVGNDIGGFLAYASVSSGTSSAAPTVTATAGGTTTNVRGPLIVLRIRQLLDELTANNISSGTPTVQNGTIGNPWQIAIAGEVYQTDLETAIADPNLLKVSNDWLIYYVSTTQDSYGDEPSFRQWIRRMTSLDGKTWTKDSGAALSWSGSGWDSIRIETPSVVYDSGAPAGKEYKLYYAGATNLHPQGFPNYKIGLATSADGITFTRFGTTPILDWDDFFPSGVDGTVADPEVIISGGFYHLYCTCYARASGGAVLGYGVAYAYSANGETFTPVAILFNNCQAPSILLNGSTFEMYYTRKLNEEYEGVPSTFNPTIGVWRTTSTDLINWTEEATRPFSWDSSKENENLGLLTGVDVAYINSLRHYCFSSWSDRNVPTGFVVPTESGNVPAVLKLSIREGDRAQVSVSLTSTNISSGTPTTSTSILTQIHVLSSTNISSGTPTVQQPTLGIIHPLTATSVSSGTPTTQSATLSTTHALNASNTTSGTPTTQNASITQKHTLNSASTNSGTPTTQTVPLTQHHNLVASNTVSGTPTTQVVPITQKHSLLANNTNTPTPTTGTPTLNQLNALLASNISSGIPTTQSVPLTQKHVLLANNTTSGTPTTQTISITQLHGLIGTNVSSGTPATTNSTITQVHVLTANNTSTGTPTTSTPSISEAGTLVAGPLNSGTPTVSSPQLTQVHTLTGQSTTSGVPNTNLPTLTVATALIANNVTTGTPTVTDSLLSQVHNLSGTVLSLGIPNVTNSILTQLHLLNAIGAFTATPTVSNTLLQIVTAVIPTIIIVGETTEINVPIGYQVDNQPNDGSIENFMIVGHVK